MSADPTDDALMRAFASGDDGAFEALVDRHGPDLKAYALRMLRNREAAEDAYVETFTRVAHERDRWTPGPSVRGWLFTITHRPCIDVLRRREVARRLEPQVIDLEAMRPIEPSPEAALLGVQYRRNPAKH